MVKNGEAVETNCLVTILLWAAACEWGGWLIYPYLCGEFYIIMQIVAERLKCMCKMVQMSPFVRDYYFY